MIFPKGIDNSQNRVYNINRDEQMFGTTKRLGAARCGGSVDDVFERPKGQSRAVRQGDREVAVVGLR